mmetsp:Transcript_14351/g.21504  ORF Transcript_14351/g.21504 Transcript_14351/m.21504 type:complete len:338 (+) Transcript_14351:256-1269(+)
MHTLTDHYDIVIRFASNMSYVLLGVVGVGGFFRALVNGHFRRPLDLFSPGGVDANKPPVGEAVKVSTGRRTSSSFDAIPPADGLVVSDSAASAFALFSGVVGVEGIDNLPLLHLRSPFKLPFREIPLPVFSFGGFGAVVASLSLLPQNQEEEDGLGVGVVVGVPVGLVLVITDMSFLLRPFLSFFLLPVGVDTAAGLGFCALLVAGSRDGLQVASVNSGGVTRPSLSLPFFSDGGSIPTNVPRVGSLTEVGVLLFDLFSLVVLAPLVGVPLADLSTSLYFCGCSSTAAEVFLDASSAPPSSSKTPAKVNFDLLLSLPACCFLNRLSWFSAMRIMRIT